jgi:N-acyl-D-amino-acid deacylase
VDERVEIFVTWSSPHPQMAGQPLSAIAEQWKIPQIEAARRLQPAGAIYHSMAEDDMRRILRHPATMIGSDGLPNDPMPHPRLWGTFPRVLGRYCRDEKLLPLAQAIHKMTGMPASRFAIADRGFVREGCFADLTLFDPENIIDTATFSKPRQTAEGIMAVWVNGVLSYQEHKPRNQRGGRFLRHAKRPGRSEESAGKTRSEGRKDWE